MWLSGSPHAARQAKPDDQNAFSPTPSRPRPPLRPHKPWDWRARASSPTLSILASLPHRRPFPTQHAHSAPHLLPVVSPQRTYGPKLMGATVPPRVPPPLMRRQAPTAPTAAGGSRARTKSPWSLSGRQAAVETPPTILHSAHSPLPMRTATVVAAEVKMKNGSRLRPKRGGGPRRKGGEGTGKKMGITMGGSSPGMEARRWRRGVAPTATGGGV